MNDIRNLQDRKYYLVGGAWVRWNAIEEVFIPDHCITHHEWIDYVHGTDYGQARNEPPKEACQ